MRLSSVCIALAVAVTATSLAQAETASGGPLPPPKLVDEITLDRDHVNTFALSPDGAAFVTGALDGNVELWNLDGTLMRALDGLRGEIVDVGFSPDGNLVASACVVGTAGLWRAASGELVGTLYAEGEPWPRAVAFSPGGKTVATGGTDRIVSLWDTATGTLTATMKDGEDDVAALAFSPDGSMIAAGSGEKDRKARIWDVASGELLATLDGGKGAVTALAFSPDGSTLAMGLSSGTIELRSAAGWTRTAQFEAHDADFTSLAFNQNGSILAAASEDETWSLWNPKLGVRLYRSGKQGATVSGAEFGPNDELVYTIDYKGRLRSWELGAN